MSERRDFWLSCGHHLLDRDEGGGLLVTDEFLKAYLARPEIAPPAEACAAERALHGALAGRSRGRRSAPAEIAAIADADARENWEVMVGFRDHLARHRTLEAAYLDIVRRNLKFPHHFPEPDRARDPAQRAGRLRGRIRAACRRAVFPAAEAHPARRLAGGGRRGDGLGARQQAAVAAGVDAGIAGRRRDRRPERGQCRTPIGSAATCSTWRSILRRAGAASQRSASRGRALDCASARRSRSTIEPLVELRGCDADLVRGPRCRRQRASAMPCGRARSSTTRRERRVVGLYRLTFADPADVVVRRCAASRSI